MGSKIYLKKEVYEVKKTKDILNTSFIEFSPELRTVEEFFNIYNNKFYSILNTTHEFFVLKSLEYIQTWVNPKQITIQNLQVELNNIQTQIDSSEQFHPIFLNNSVLSPQSINQYENIVNCSLFYINSGKARVIKGDQKQYLFSLIKSQQRFQGSNQDFIINVNQEVIDGLPKTKPIENEGDLNDSFLILNNYNGPTS